jgi:hypothetical protein
MCVGWLQIPTNFKVVNRQMSYILTVNAGIAPKLNRFPDYKLPHITIQMPVYKEGLKNVIIPTITSLLKAIKDYEAHGGTVNIYINDDGMRLVDEKQAEARKAFYELHEIGWCSRPQHKTDVDKDDPEYFERRGKFKKASNMNYCLDFSLRVEEEMLRQMDARCAAHDCTYSDLTMEDESELYDTARDFVVASDNGRTWAAGDCRIGELILIIDSDVSNNILSWMDWIRKLTF